MTERFTGPSRFGVAAAALTAAVALAAACGSDDRPARTSMSQPMEAGLPAEYQELLDLGNQAFRDEDFQAAADHFRAAVALEPEIASGWFGVYMAEARLSNREAAAEALARSQALAPGSGFGEPDDAHGDPHGPPPGN